jgi:signal transduction histidine kinase/CheY-like chemotaxis protein
VVVGEDQQRALPLPSTGVSAPLQHCDWLRSPLGPPENWSPSLKTTVGIMLAAQAQIVLFWGPQFVALYNDAYAPTIGDKHPRALGRPAVENWAELWDDLGPLLQGVRATGRTFHAKDRPFYIERHGYGETVYFDVSYSAVPEVDGSVGGVLCIVSETTSRVLGTRRQAALLELEDRLRTVHSTDEATRIAADLLRRELGASSVDYSSLEAKSPAQQEAADTTLARLALRDDVCALDIPVLRDNQVAGRFTITGTPPRCWTDEEAHFARSVAERAWSTAERVRAEALLRKNEVKYRTLFEQIDEGFCVVELLDGEHGPLSDYRHVESNPAFSVNTGLPDVLGKRLREMYPQGVDEWIQTIRQVLLTGEPVRLERELASTGRYLEIAAFRMGPVERRRVAVLLKDVSTRKRAEAQLQSLNRELEQRVARAIKEREEALARIHEMQKLETIGQLTGGVAHDFNNLLTPIMGALEMVARLKEGDARIRQLAAAGLQAAERARTLVQRLLAFARRQHLQARPTAIGHLVCGMEDLLTRSLGPQIRLEIDCDAALPPALTDPNQLELALLNLAVNARDAMPDGGRLRIAITEQSLRGHAKLTDGRYIRIAVSDTGLGMDDQTMRRAVEPFFTTKTKGQGTGLGLSMVHGFAAQLGGHFALSSEPGHGTTASLWLPASIEPAWTEPERAAAKAELRTVPPTPVLLVDDEELVRHGTAEMLSNAGYVVQQVASGYEALAMLAKGTEVRALITDYAMPGMTGIELARQARQLRPSLPVLMITGFAALDEQAAGSLPRLSKPFRQAELVDTLAALLEPAGNA